MSEHLYEESKEKRSTGEILFLIGLVGGSIWIAHNIFVANEWQLKAYLQNQFEEIGNFFRVIFTGKSQFVEEAKFTWWAIPFCGFCYLAGYLAIKLWGIFGELAEPDVHFESDVRTKILTQYSSYRKFREQFKEYDQLSKEAKKMVKGLFENGD